MKNLYTKRVFKSFRLLAAMVLCLFATGAIAQSTSKLSVQLLLNQQGGNQNTADGLVAVFGPNFSTAVAAEDSYKFSNANENIAIMRNGIKLSIEGRPSITGTDTLPLLIWQLRQSNYCLQIDPKNFPQNVTAVLKDAYLQQNFPVDLSAKTVLPFSLNADSASFAANRFTIILQANSTLPVSFSNCKVQRQNRHVLLSWTYGCQTNADHFVIEKSTDGRSFFAAANLLSTGKACSEAYNWTDDNATNAAGFYRVRVIEHSGNSIVSQVMKITAQDAPGTLRLFPNPVIGRVVNLQLTGTLNNSYRLKIINTSGQQVLTTTATTTAGNTLQLALPKQMKAGLYNVQLTNEQQVINQWLLVQ